MATEERRCQNEWEVVQRPWGRGRLEPSRNSMKPLPCTSMDSVREVRSKAEPGSWGREQGPGVTFLGSCSEDTTPEGKRQDMTWDTTEEGIPMVGVFDSQPARFTVPEGSSWWRDIGGRGRKVPVLSTNYAVFVCLLSPRLGTNLSGTGALAHLNFHHLRVGSGIYQDQASFYRWRNWGPKKRMVIPGFLVHEALECTIPPQAIW